MLFITGNGRSGTSVIAAFCHKVGFNNAGGDYIDVNIRGGAETAAVLSFITRFNNGENVDSEIAELKKFDIIKSPQLVNQGSKALWLKMKECFGDFRVLLTRRDWLDTARSFSKYNMHEQGGHEIYSEKEIYFLANRLKSYFENTLSILEELKVPYSILNFPDFLFDYEGTVSTLNSVGLFFDAFKAKSVWDAFVSTEGYSLTEKKDISIPTRKPSHSLMIVSEDEVAELALLPNKTTIIIPEYDDLTLLIFSYLLCNKPNESLDHFMIFVDNDYDQWFLEELRNLKWYHKDNPENSRDMPITLIRPAFSCSTEQKIKSALSWVHTQKFMVSSTCIAGDWKQLALNKKLLYNFHSGWYNMGEYALREQILAHPEYSKLYVKYHERRNPQHN